MTDSKSEYDYESPCVHTCVVDQVSGFCRGCGRTLHEISYWTRYTPEERQRILELLPARCAGVTLNA
jgi:predicted Fe-S protein YdhL (DUF1289 family)